MKQVTKNFFTYWIEINFEEKIKDSMGNTIAKTLMSKNSCKKRPTTESVTGRIIFVKIREEKSDVKIPQRKLQR